jgi:superfamily II DNA or RNA helicase
MTATFQSLRDYQADALDKLLNPPPGVSRDLAVMATGGGKTILFAALIEATLKPGERALVLAHREELLDQAAAKIAMVDPALHVEIEQAARRATRHSGDGLFAFSNPLQRSVVVASVQTLHDRRRADFAPNAFALIIVDEAHHSTADSYLDILDYFGCMEGRTRLVGVTATPNRTDGKPLGDVYQRIACEYGIRELVARDYLVRPRGIRLQTSVDLSAVRTRAGDFAQGELQEAVNVEARNLLIAKALRDYCADRQTIVFTAGVEHAHELASLAVSAGFRAAPIWGAMPKEDRAADLAAFARGELQVLTNFGVLTEGFDVPSVSAIVLGRPTKSSLLLTQMVGRGLRLADGKTDCLIIDVQDVTRKATCVSAATLAGLPAEFDAQGDDLFATAGKYESIDPRLAKKCLSAAQLADLMERLAAGVDVLTVDLLGATALDPVVEANSKYAWISTAPDTYGISVGKQLDIAIRANTLGQYETYFRDGQRNPWQCVTAAVGTIEDAFGAADRFIATRFPDVGRLIDREAKWRGDPPTASQIHWLLKKKVFATRDDIPEGMTKGQASVLLDKAFGR